MQSPTTCGNQGDHLAYPPDGLSECFEPRPKGPLKEDPRPDGLRVWRGGRSRRGTDRPPKEHGERRSEGPSVCGRSGGGQGGLDAAQRPARDQGQAAGDLALLRTGLGEPLSTVAALEAASLHVSASSVGPATAGRAPCGDGSHVPWPSSLRSPRSASPTTDRRPRRPAWLRRRGPRRRPASVADAAAPYGILGREAPS